MRGDVVFEPGPDGDYGKRRLEIAAEYLRTKRLRWDTYFYNVANAVGGNSLCLSRKIGAVLTRDKAIISTGYNGPPAGIPVCSERYHIDPMVGNKVCEMDYGSDPNDLICPRYFFGFNSGEGLEYCVAGHAERNSLIQAAKNGIHTLGSIMYINCPIPCKDCLIEIINAGVSEIVCTSLDYYDEASKYLIKQAHGLQVRELVLE